jgi:hypothetical protein
MVEIKDLNGKIVSRSKNLRGILRMAGKQGVQEITITPVKCAYKGCVFIGGPSARLWILFFGGLEATVDFGSITVCEQWIRRPVFKGAAIHIG